MGDAPAAEPEPIPDRMDEYGDLSPEDVLRLQEKAEMDDKLNARVLAGGAVERRPMHVSSIMLGVLSLGMLWFLVLNPSLRSMQPIPSYAVMVMGLGTAAWGGSGAMRGEDSGLQRALCGIGAALGVLALVVAFVQRNPGVGG